MHVAGPDCYFAQLMAACTNRSRTCYDSQHVPVAVCTLYRSNTTARYHLYKHQVSTASFEVLTRQRSWRVLYRGRSLASKAVQQDLAEAPLLHDLQQQLLRQLPLCSNECWSRAAFACSIFVQLRCFRPSAEFLAALEAELLSRLASAPEQDESRFLRACVTEVLHTFSYCAWPVSAALQQRVADWLLGRGGAGERVLTRMAGGAQTLTPRQAEKVLRAWVMIAVTPGAPARAALPAVLHALDGPLAALPKLGGAAGVLARALTIQLNTAPSVQVRPGLAGAPLQTACRGAGIACLAVPCMAIYVCGRVWSYIYMCIYIYIYGYVLGAHSRAAGRKQLYIYMVYIHITHDTYMLMLWFHTHSELHVACSAGLVCAAALTLSRRISAFTLGPWLHASTRDVHCI